MTRQLKKVVAKAVTHMNDNHNVDCSSNDSSFEHDPSDNDMISIPDDYSPENGAESDEDTGKCCHWSKIQNYRNKIDLADGMAPHGSPRVVIPDDTAPADIAKQVLDDDFIDMAINCTVIVKEIQNMNNTYWKYSL